MKQAQQVARIESIAAGLRGVRQGLFVSDLHLFSPRSAGDKLVAELAEIGGPYDCLVLGGDIFDFRWSRHGSHVATLDAAERWLLDLRKGTPAVPVVFLPGNHDCHPEFLAILESLAAKDPQFFWADHHAQIGDCLFLHGDVLDAGGLRALEGYRRRFHHETPQSVIAHRSYDVAVEMRMHKLIPKLRHKPQRTCQRLLDVMPDLILPSRQLVQQVYFGHTHVPIHGLEIGGIRFFNPGAALRHMDTHIHSFTTSEEPAR